MSRSRAAGRRERNLRKMKSARNDTRPLVSSRCPDTIRLNRGCVMVARATTRRAVAKRKPARGPVAVTVPSGADPELTVLSLGGGQCVVCYEPVLASKPRGGPRVICHKHECRIEYQRRACRASRDRRRVAVIATEGKVTCRVCGGSYRRVGYPHLRRHGLTVSQYRTKYPDAQTENAAVKNTLRGSAARRARYLTRPVTKITPQLQSVLMGALLGDGSCRPLAERDTQDTVKEPPMNPISVGKRVFFSKPLVVSFLLGCRCRTSEPDGVIVAGGSEQKYTHSLANGSHSGIQKALRLCLEYLQVSV